MAKYTYRLNVIEFWRVGELESWYRHMASKGYELIKASNSFSKFKKVPPQDVLYRIEITTTDEIDEEQLFLLEDSGWDYVTSIQHFHIFRAPAERNAPEIHSDPTVQAEAFQKLGQRTKRQAIAVSVIGLLLVPIFIGYILSMEAPLYYLFVQNQYYIFFQYFFIYFIIGYTWYNAFRIKRVKRQLDEGVALAHDVPFKRFKLWYVILLVIACSGFISILFQGPNNTTYVPYDESLPLIRLAMIEDDDSLTTSNELVNDIELQKSTLIKPQYVAKESLRSQNLYYEDGSGIYEPTIFQEYYYVKLPMLSKPLYESIKDHELYRGDYTQITHPYFDAVHLYEEQNFHEMIVRKGQHIVFVRYFGMQSAEDVLAALEDVIRKMQ